jgi:hypothetical protein
VFDTSLSAPFLFLILPVLPYYIRNSVEILISDTNGLFNFLMPGTSFYSAIDASSWLVSILMKLAFLLQKHWEKYCMLSSLKVV